MVPCAPEWKTGHKANNDIKERKGNRTIHGSNLSESSIAMWCALKTDLGRIRQEVVK